MDIREAYIKEEYDQVREFLASFNLSMDKTIDKTFYAVEEDGIIGTISVYKNVIKELAVSNEYRSENLSSTLISHAISYLQSKGTTHYFVFTKKEYEMTFLSMGLKKITSTEKTVMLEGGDRSIDDAIDGIKTQIKFSFGELEGVENISSIVLNADPITNGHVSLIEEASKNSSLVILFVVEEDASYFSFKERFSLVYLAVKRLGNIIVVPSSEYMVSRTTFPDYFLKSADEATREHALIDSKIFKDYFMRELSIKYRYIGTETKDHMAIYNSCLKETLGESIREIERFKDDKGEIISASKVRSLIDNGQIDEAMENVPRECASVMMLSLYARR